MKIIEAGTPQEIAVFHGQCSACKAIVECEENEMSYDITATNIVKAIIKCPTLNCKANIYLSKGKFQEPWSDLVYTRREWQATPIIKQK